jgi:hypothetical protein
MIPLLTYPLALLAALSVPTLVAIYFFRNRFRRSFVAGLFLWDSALRAREGGTVIRRMRGSWLFALELLALLALTLAATDPRLPFDGAQRTLVVVLDDSASMAAGAPGARPRELGLALVQRTLRRERFRRVRYIVAGRQPTLIEADRGLAELADAWTCQAPGADIDAALALAVQLAADRARILVVSDRAPAEAPAPGRMRWEAVGRGAPNLGFVEARRALDTGRDRLFVALGNYTPEARTVELAFLSDGARIHTERVDIPAGGVADTALSLPPGTGAVRVRLPDDALAIDNAVLLLPEAPRRVRVRVALSDPDVAACVEQAVSASGLAEVGQPTELLVTDRAEVEAGAEAWRLLVFSPTGAVAFSGPFVVDGAHPLGDGLAFEGAVWGGSPELRLPGSPVILAGNVPLLTVQTQVSAKRLLNLQFVPQLSNVQRTPAWPGLMWNVLDWRAAALPGVAQANVHAGTTVSLTAPGGVAAAVCDGPDGTRTLAVRGRQAFVPLPVQGSYTLTAGSWRGAVAANFCAPQESDLRSQATGSWGDWHAPEVLLRDYASWAWPAAFVALAALVLHTVLIARRALPAGEAPT